jgi:hypothetical protein
MEYDIMGNYVVQFEGIDSYDKNFVENIKIKAKDEDEARQKAHEIFMIPWGISRKYSGGSGAVRHWMKGVARLLPLKC